MRTRCDSGEILMRTCKTLLRPQRGRGEVTPVGQLHPPQSRGSAEPLRRQFLRQAPNHPTIRAWEA